MEAFDEVRLVLEAGGNVVASTKEAKEKWVELYEVVCYVARRVSRVQISLQRTGLTFPAGV